MESLTVDHQKVIDDINQQHADAIATLKDEHQQVVTEASNRQAHLLSEATKGSDDVIQELNKELAEHQQIASDAKAQLEKAEQQNQLLAQEIEQHTNHTLALSEQVSYKR